MPYVFVKSKQELGAQLGTSRNVVATSVIKNKASSLNSSIEGVKDQIEKFFIGGAEEMENID